MSAHPNSDLNPVLAAGGARLSVASSGESPRSFTHTLREKGEVEQSCDVVCCAELQGDDGSFSSTRNSSSAWGKPP